MIVNGFVRPNQPVLLFVQLCTIHSYTRSSTLIRTHMEQTKDLCCLHVLVVISERLASMRPAFVHEKRQTVSHGLLRADSTKQGFSRGPPERDWLLVSHCTR